MLTVAATSGFVHRFHYRQKTKKMKSQAYIDEQVVSTSEVTATDPRKFKWQGALQTVKEQCPRRPRMRRFRHLPPKFP